MANSTPWTPEREEIACRMWKEGKTATDILQALDCGLTRSAVCGKLNRMGMGKEARDGAVKLKKPKPPKPAPAPVTEKKVVVFPKQEIATTADFGIPESRRVRLVDLAPNSCRFPLGDPLSDGFSFCGAIKPIDGKPYCGAHEAIAYRPSSIRRVFSEEEKLRRRLSAIKGGVHQFGMKEQR